MKIGKLELKSEELIEYSGDRVLQEFPLKDIKGVQTYWGYPVPRPMLNLILGLVLMLPLLVLLYFGVSKSLLSGGELRYRIESYSNSLYISFVFLPVWGCCFLWPLRNKVMNVSLQVDGCKKLLNVSDLSKSEVEAFAAALEAKLRACEMEKNEGAD